MCQPAASRTLRQRSTMASRSRVGLCGQADHEVELDPPAQPFSKSRRTLLDQFSLGHSLVDDIAQPLAARLRGQGRAGAPDGRDCAP